MRMTNRLLRQCGGDACPALARSKSLSALRFSAGQVITIRSHVYSHGSRCVTISTAKKVLLISSSILVASSWASSM